MQGNKFDLKKCKRCIYHGGTKSTAIYCNYSALGEGTTLKRSSGGNIYDMRGNDYHNCLLFKARGKTRRRERDGKD